MKSLKVLIYAMFLDAQWLLRNAGSNFKNTVIFAEMQK